MDRELVTDLFFLTHSKSIDRVFIFVQIEIYFLEYLQLLLTYQGTLVSSVDFAASFFVIVLIDTG